MRVAINCSCNASNALCIRERLPVGLGPVILLGIAAGILSVEIQRRRGDRQCPAGQRARVPADGRLLFLARNTRRAERVGFAALLAEGLRARR